MCRYVAQPSLCRKPLDPMMCTICVRPSQTHSRAHAANNTFSEGSSATQTWNCDPVLYQNEIQQIGQRDGRYVIMAVLALQRQCPVVAGTGLIQSPAVPVYVAQIGQHQGLTSPNGLTGPPAPLNLAEHTPTVGDLPPFSKVVKGV